MYEQMTTDEYRQRFHTVEEPHLLLDVRTVEEFEDFRIPGAVNIPLDELSVRVDEISELAGDGPIVMVCRTGIRSLMGAQLLRFSGLEDLPIFNLSDGTLGWKQRGWPLDRGDIA